MSDPVALPEWVATVTGRLLLENEALRRLLAELQMSDTPAPTEIADPEPVKP